MCKCRCTCISPAAKQAAVALTWAGDVCATGFALATSDRSTRNELWLWWALLLSFIVLVLFAACLPRPFLTKHCGARHFNVAFFLYVLLLSAAVAAFGFVAAGNDLTVAELERACASVALDAVFLVTAAAFSDVFPWRLVRDSTGAYVVRTPDDSSISCLLCPVAHPGNEYPEIRSRAEPAAHVTAISDEGRVVFDNGAAPQLVSVTGFGVTHTIEQPPSSLETELDAEHDAELQRDRASLTTDKMSLYPLDKLRPAEGEWPFGDQPVLRVFMSHRSRDTKPLVRIAYRALNETEPAGMGVPTFFDKDTLSGENIGRCISHAMTHARIVVAWFSPRFDKQIGDQAPSDWCKRELLAALEWPRDKYIIPVFFDVQVGDVPKRLTRVNGYELKSSSTGKHVFDELAKLVDTVCGKCGRKKDIQRARGAVTEALLYYRQEEEQGGTVYTDDETAYAEDAIRLVRAAQDFVARQQ